MLSTNQHATNRRIVYDVFIPYHNSDRDDARNLENRLKKDMTGGTSLKVFIAPWDVLPGKNFVFAIEEALSNARYFLPLLSPSSLEADWPRAEQAVAIISDPAGRLGRIIPVLVKDCKVPPLLAFRQRIDLRDKTKYEAEIARLICLLKGLALPATAKDLMRVPRKVETSMAVGTVSGSSASPDMVDERIYSNLFEVRSMPSNIWRAPTSFTTKSQVIQFLNLPVVAPFLVKENTIFSFSDLSAENNQFRRVMDPGDKEQENVKLWSSDEDRRRWLVELLNDSIRSFCRELRMQFDYIGGKHYFPVGVLKPEAVEWTPHVRKSHRDLIFVYEKDGQPTLYRHRAAGLRFELVGSRPFLRIETGSVFTEDGSSPIESRKKRAILSLRFQSKQKNLQALDETRFWAWLLSDDGSTIKLRLGGPTLEVDTMPVSALVRGGVFGDRKALPRIVESPPKFTETTHQDDYSEAEAVTEALEEEES